MERGRVGQAVFLGAIAVAAALYGLTMPTGLPWNESTRLAAAYLGDVVRMPAMPHPIWGFYVQVAGGAVLLSAALSAFGAGLLSALVNRYFGWRFASATAIVWTFLPGVWNRAITGERGVCLAAMAVAALWAANAVGLWAFHKVWPAKEPVGKRGVAAVAHDVRERRAKVNRIAGWAALGAALAFAVVSMSMHDYRMGEAASAFARGVVAAADGRIIVMNGVCDAQVVSEVKKAKSGGEGDQWDLSYVSLREDDGYRRALAAAVKCEWPTETNLWIAAQVGANAFLEVAMKKHPERFYRMNGKSTTAKDWESRWAAFKPYLGSDDPFVAMGRRLFGYEGNCVANAMLDGERGEKGENGEKGGKVEGEGQGRKDTSLTSRPPQPSAAKAAWQLYRRIYEEIDPGNFSALVNMSEMIRRGHAVGGEEKKMVQGAVDAFFKDVKKRQHVREIMRASGPVRTDPAELARMEAETKKRIAERIAAGEKVEVSPEAMSLIEWNNEMVHAMNRGDLAAAGRLARKILSNPKWHGFIPANATMGTVALSEGDYVASEAFFRTATDTTNAVPAVVLNDYADTLMNLGKTDEAVRIARRAVAASGEEFWLARLTLAEALAQKVGKRTRAEVVKNGERRGEFVAPADAEKVNAEIRGLLRSVSNHGSADARDAARNMLREVGK